MYVPVDFFFFVSRVFKTCILLFCKNCLETNRCIWTIPRHHLVRYLSIDCVDVCVHACMHTYRQKNIYIYIRENLGTQGEERFSEEESTTNSHWLSMGAVSVTSDYKSFCNEYGYAHLTLKNSFNFSIHLCI